MTTRSRERPTRIDVERRRPRNLRDEPAGREAAQGGVAEQRAILERLGVTGFSTEYARLLKLSKSEDFSSAQAGQALTRAMLGMYINALPKIEEDLYKYGGRAIYSAVAAGDHIRALSHDLRAYGDNSAMVEKIRRDCVQPALGSLATDIISHLTELTSEMHTTLPPREARAVGQRLRHLQASLTRMFKDAEHRAHELIQRTLTE